MKLNNNCRRRISGFFGDNMLFKICLFLHLSKETFDRVFHETCDRHRTYTARYRRNHRCLRFDGRVVYVTAELTECIPANDDSEREYDSQRIREEINAFLYSQPKERRVMFVLRYFNSKSIDEIAFQLGLSVPNVKTTLHRLRRELQKRLEEQELL